MPCFFHYTPWQVYATTQVRAKCILLNMQEL